MGELWDIFCKDFEKKWLCYKGAALYIYDGVSEVPKFSAFPNCPGPSTFLGGSVKPVCWHLYETSGSQEGPW